MAWSPSIDKMLVAQISDIHITRKDGPLARMVDTDHTLKLMVAELNAMAAKPDVVLLTGDLVDSGDPEEYAALGRLLAPLEIPQLVLAGNHDNIPALTAALPHLVPAGLAEGHFSYVNDAYPVRLIGLDTSVPGADHGEFDAPRATWLRAVLAEGSAEPTLLFMHHPPFATGIRWMDLTALRGAREFAAVIAEHPEVKLVVAGHLHRPVQTVFGTTLVSICPSTAFQVGLHLEPTRAEVTDQPPSYQLHLWRDGRFVTHTAPVWHGQSADLGDHARHLEAEAGQAG
jgi:Icc protein